MPHRNHFDAGWLFITILALTWIGIGLRELFHKGTSQHENDNYESEKRSRCTHDHPSTPPPQSSP
jgi:hypothetical protein